MDASLVLAEGALSVLRGGGDTTVALRTAEGILGRRDLTVEEAVLGLEETVAMKGRGGRPLSAHPVSAPPAGGQGAFSEDAHPRAGKGAQGGGRFVKKGETSPRVTAMQSRLNELGHGAPSHGSFDRHTERAVKDFQGKYGLPKTGHVDEATLELMRNPPPISIGTANRQVQAAIAGAGGTLERGATGPAVRQLHATLEGIGVENPDGEGTFGPGTEAAIRKLQRENGMAATGHADPQTMAMLERLSREEPTGNIAGDAPGTWGSAGHANPRLRPKPNSSARQLRHAIQEEAMAATERPLDEASYGGNPSTPNSPSSMTRITHGGTTPFVVARGAGLDTDDLTPPPNLREASPGAFDRCRTCIFFTVDGVCREYGWKVEEDDLCDTFDTLTPADQQHEGIFESVIGEIAESAVGRLGSVRWDPGKHPRQRGGKFAHTLGSARPGDVVHLRHSGVSVEVKKHHVFGQHYVVHSSHPHDPALRTQEFQSPDEAASEALKMHDHRVERISSFAGDRREHSRSEARLARDEAKPATTHGEWEAVPGGHVREVHGQAGTVYEYRVAGKPGQRLHASKEEAVAAVSRTNSRQAAKTATVMKLSDHELAQRLRVVGEGKVRDRLMAEHKRRAENKRTVAKHAERVRSAALPPVSGAEYMRRARKAKRDDAAAMSLRNSDAEFRAAMFHALEEVKSSAYPSLDRSSKENWVDKAGGLPSYIERIAKHIHYEGGKSISTAIAMSVSTVKRWCAGGAVSKTGPHASGVSEKTKALACKAVAEWEAKKASRHVAEAELLIAEAGFVGDDGEFHRAQPFPPSLNYCAKVLAAVEEAYSDWDEWVDGWSPSFVAEADDLGLSESVLDVLRRVKWDPHKHPRGRGGKFSDVLAGITAVSANKRVERELARTVSHDRTSPRRRASLEPAQSTSWLAPDIGKPNEPTEPPKAQALRDRLSDELDRRAKETANGSGDASFGDAFLSGVPIPEWVKDMEGKGAKRGKANEPIDTSAVDAAITATLKSFPGLQDWSLDGPDDTLSGGKVWHVNVTTDQGVKHRVRVFDDGKVEDAGDGVTTAKLPSAPAAVTPHLVAKPMYPSAPPAKPAYLHGEGTGEEEKPFHMPDGTYFHGHDGKLYRKVQNTKMMGKKGPLAAVEIENVTDGTTKIAPAFALQTYYEMLGPPGSVKSASVPSGDVFGDLMKSVGGSGVTSLSGQHVVLTGTIEGQTRDQVKAKLAAAGAHVHSSVSNQVDLLITGDKGGKNTTKAKAAAAKGIKVVSFSEVEHLLEASVSRDVLRLIDTRAELLEAVDAGETTVLRAREAKLVERIALRESKLSAAERNALPDSAFALPGRRYPVHDEGHAKAALGRVAEFGTPDEQARVRAAVAARHPGVEKATSSGRRKA